MDVDEEVPEEESGEKVGLPQTSHQNDSALREHHEGFFGFEHAYIHYLNTILLALRLYAAIKDDARLSVVLKTLLRGERQWMAELQWQFRNPVTHERFSNILMAMYQFMACHQHTFIESDVRRILKEMERYEMDSFKINRIQELDATLLAEAGRLSDAYDVLSGPLGLSTTKQKHNALLGVLRKRQLYAILDAEGQRVVESFERWQHNPRIWGRLGRNGRQLSPQAKSHLKQASLEHPSETCSHIHLIELLSTEGDDKGASDVALSMLEARREIHVLDYDSNAQYLMLLLKNNLSTSTKEFDNVQEHYVKEATECCIRLLDIDPGSGDTLRLVCKFISAHEDVYMKAKFPNLVGIIDKLITSVGVVECKTSQLHALVEIEKMLHALSVDSPMDWTKCVGLLMQQKHWTADMFFPDKESWPVPQRWHLYSLGIIWETAVESHFGLFSVKNQAYDAINTGYISRKVAQCALDEREQNIWLKTRLEKQLHQLAQVHDVLF